VERRAAEIFARAFGPEKTKMFHGEHRRTVFYVEQFLHCGRRRGAIFDIESKNFVPKRFF